jgi:hypothetical protein
MTNNLFIFNDRLLEAFIKELLVIPYAIITFCITNAGYRSSLIN